MKSSMKQRNAIDLHSTIKNNDEVLIIFPSAPFLLPFLSFSISFASHQTTKNKKCKARQAATKHKLQQTLRHSSFIIISIKKHKDSLYSIKDIQFQLIHKIYINDGITGTSSRTQTKGK